MQAILDDTQHGHDMPALPPGPLGGPISWTRDTLRPEDGLVKVTSEVRQELDELVAQLRANPLPIEALDVAEFALPAARAMMAEVQHVLKHGVGFVIIDRLPMDAWSVPEARAVYWLLSQLVARPVAQSWDGKLVYDVRDLGKPVGPGVRPDTTNAEQNFHTDNSYNLCAPDYVSLLCVRPALEGGMSSIVSFYSVFDEMRRRHPGKVARLFQPYLFDRLNEHAPGDARVINHPLVELVDGQLRFRLSHRHTVNGYTLAGREIDAEGLDALETLEATMREPQFAREFWFEPGQIQIVDNTRLGHRRTHYVDFPEFERKRHLVRLWLRDRGRRFYNG